MPTAATEETDAERALSTAKATEAAERAHPPRAMAKQEDELAVLDALGKPASLKVNVSERMGQVDRHIGSTEKAKRLLGWEARTSFADGLERTVAWYRQNEAWWRGVLERSETPLPA